MPNTLRLSDGSYMRRPDVQRIMEYLSAMQCVEVIGYSNIGKSALLRLLSQTDVWIQELGEAGQDFIPIYIDCNRMLEMSGQGFYEVVLRCIQESENSEQLAVLPELQETYETLVAPASEFQVPLSFNKGITAVLESTALKSKAHKLVLLIDEFDEPFTQIDSRVFLNLRALKDRHRDKLVYVTATGNPLTQQRTEDHCAEFCELFSHRSWNLAPLTRSDVERFVRRYVEAYETPFTAEDINFIYTWAGGHPRMLEGVCRKLDTALGETDNDFEDSTARWQFQRIMGRQLRFDEDLTRECTKIWDSCTEEEQMELSGLFMMDHAQNQHVIESLSRRHLILKIDGKYQLFCRLMTEYVQRKSIQGQSASAKLWLDMDAGEVWINDEPVETLTNLEYRLILILYQNAGKVVDKFQIVTHVWGESYIDEVDDSRIDKLVSRLRQKMESVGGGQRFLTTVRGRGYRLVLE